MLSIAQGAVTKGRFYSVEGNELRILAGQIIWVRGKQAGMFFKQALHPLMVDRIRDHSSESNGGVNGLVLAPLQPRSG